MQRAAFLLLAVLALFLCLPYVCALRLPLIDRIVQYGAPQPTEGVVMFDDFQDDEWAHRWVQSQLPKYEGRFEVAAQPEAMAALHQERGLHMPTSHLHYAISRRFPTPLDPNTQDVVVQYEVRHTNGSTCSGAYIKLMAASPDFDGAALGEDTPYSLLFGPDKCGSKRFRLMVQQEGSARSLRNAPKPLHNDQTHIFTLHLRPDRTFSIYIDMALVKEGGPEDFEPALSLSQPIPKIGAAAFELWTTDGGIFLDNVLVGTHLPTALQLARESWEPRRAVEDATMRMNAEWNRHSFFEIVGRRAIEIYDAHMADPVWTSIYSLIGIVPVSLILIFSGSFMDNPRLKKEKKEMEAKSRAGGAGVKGAAGKKSKKKNE